MFVITHDWNEQVIEKYRSLSTECLSLRYNTFLNIE